MIWIWIWIWIFVYNSGVHMVQSPKKKEKEEKKPVGNNAIYIRKQIPTRGYPGPNALSTKHLAQVENACAERLTIVK
jgi:hypothetical protein